MIVLNENLIKLIILRSSPNDLSSLIFINSKILNVLMNDNYFWWQKLNFDNFSSEHVFSNEKDYRSEYEINLKVFNQIYQDYINLLFISSKMYQDILHSYQDIIRGFYIDYDNFFDYEIKIPRDHKYYKDFYDLIKEDIDSELDSWKDGYIKRIQMYNYYKKVFETSNLTILDYIYDFGPENYMDAIARNLSRNMPAYKINFLRKLSPSFAKIWP